MATWRDRRTTLWVKAKVARAQAVARNVQLMQLGMLKNVVRVAEDPMAKARRGRNVAVGAQMAEAHEGGCTLNLLRRQTEIGLRA
eukprot:1274376-Alexandrium_andersonii.AAC.1